VLAAATVELTEQDEVVRCSTEMMPDIDVVFVANWNAPENL